MLLGLTEPTGGQARVVGLDPARYPLEVKRRVGYMPDAVGYTDLTGQENLRYLAPEPDPGAARGVDDRGGPRAGRPDVARDDQVETYSRACSSASASPTRW